MAQRTVISIGLDVANVRSELRALGQDVSRLTTQNIQAAVPQFQIPSNLGGAQLAEVQSRAQSQLVRSIMAGTPGFVPGQTGNNPAVGAAVKQYLDPIFAARFAQLPASEQAAYGAVKRGQISTQETNLLKQAEKATGDAAAVLTAAQTGSGLAALITAAQATPVGKKAQQATTQATQATQTYAQAMQQAAQAAAAHAQAHQNSLNTVAQFGRQAAAAAATQVALPPDPVQEAADQLQEERYQRQVRGQYRQQITPDDIDAMAFGRLREEELLRKIQRSYLDQITPADQLDEGEVRAGTILNDEKINAITQRELALSREFIQVRADRIQSERAIQRQTDLLLAQQRTAQDNRDDARLRVLQRRNERDLELETLRQTSPQDLASEAQLNNRRRANGDIVARLEAEEVTQSQALLNARAARIVAEQRLANATQFEVEARRTPTDLQAQGQLKALKERNDAQVTLAALEAKTAQDYAVQGRIAALRRNATIQLQTAEFRELAQNKDFQRARAERIIEERRYIAEQRKTNAQVAREQGFGGRSALARLLGRLGGGASAGIDGDSGGRYAGGIPPTLGEFFGGGLKNLARYAVPGALAYGVIGGLSSTIKEAEELDLVFANIEAQFDNAFGDQADAKFGEFRKNILDIAKDTGVAGEQIAQIGFQLQGAFGNGITIQGLSGSNLVDDQLRAAAEIERVTGLSASEITDSLTAASLAFDVSFRRIGDVTLDLQDRFGVLAKEIIPFLGDIAPVAKEAGFSLEEFATIAAITQQQSGRSGSALAEAYGRVIPAITNARQQLIDLGSDNQLGTEFLQTVGSGSIKDVFFAIANNFERMNKGAQEFVINLLGGRREASAILAAFNNSESLQREIENTQNAGDVLAERFDRIQETLSQSLARLAENFRQLGVEIYDSGLGNALEDFIDLLNVGVDVVDKMFSAIGILNDALGGIPAKLVPVIALFVTLNKAIAFLTTAKLSQSLLGLIPSVVAGRTAAAATAFPVPGTGTSPYGPTAYPGGAATAGRFQNFIGGLNPVAVGLTATTVSFAAFEQYASGRQQRENDLIAKYQAMELEEVQRILESTSVDNSPYDFSGGVIKDAGSEISRTVDKVLGGGQRKTEYQILLDEYNKKRLDPIRTKFEEIFSDKGAQEALTQLLQDKDSAEYRQLQQLVNEIEGVSPFDDPIDLGSYLSDPLKLEKVIKSAEDGGPGEFILGIVEGLAARNNILGKFFRDYNNSLAEEQAVIDRASANEIALRGLDTTKARYESGNASLSEYLDALKRRIEDRKIVLEALTAGTAEFDQTDKELNEAIQEYNKLQAENLDRVDEIRLGVLELNGDNDTTKKAQVEELLNTLRDPNYIDPEARLQKAKEVIDILKSLDEATEIPSEAREVLAEALFDPSNNEEWNAFLAAYRAIYGQMSDAVIRQVFIDFALGLRTLDEVRQELAAKRAQMSAALNQISADDAIFFQDPFGALDEAGKLLDGLEQNTPKIPTTTAGKKSSSGEDAAKKLRDAYANLARANVEGDPVRLAQLNLELADQAIAQAKDEAERINAMAERVRAVRALEAAQFDIGEGWVNLANAFYEFTGDNVAAAELAVRRAIDERDRIEALFAYGGAGDKDRLDAQAEVLRSKAQLRDAQLQDQLDEYQFLYDMGRITKQQFITYLETLKQIPDLTEAQIRDLDRQIHSLSQELQGDLQFNLPTKLRLPTLYEVRRATQAGSTQAGFVDNRQVNIVLNVNNGTTQAEMVQILEQTIGAPSRYGTGGRRY